MKTEDLIRFERERDDAGRVFGPVKIDLILPFEAEADGAKDDRIPRRPNPFYQISPPSRLMENGRDGGGTGARLDPSTSPTAPEPPCSSGPP